MGALEVFGFKHDLTGPSDHPVDAMLSSGISRNIFIWVLLPTVTGCDHHDSGANHWFGARQIDLAPISSDAIGVAFLLRDRLHARSVLEISFELSWYAEYAKNMSKICRPVWNMQNTYRSIFCLFVIYMHSPLCWWYRTWSTPLLKWSASRNRITWTSISEPDIEDFIFDIEDSSTRISKLFCHLQYWS